ncbi:hypothetical protein QR77_29110 [Streptomyces sp. 150FB]|uniref:aspartate aminotransferase family protein n=1 Tax=Streptomyces sp. 150FB TaxID=1576605 RepID=UPI0005896B31|nr:aspartate aminotransferase family protein [Streptomyces sp. 150FB]KIF76823.1 hypothetical protein QR77_29110 [Streptomyces sp. 150FB]
MSTDAMLDLESAVRSYSRSFPEVFTSAKGSWIHGGNGERYLDFLAGAGSLNYGHNPEPLKDALLAYIASDGITHGLDLWTTAKAEFMETFRDLVLAPRELDHKIQFCSPSGANAVEAALKLARLATGRHSAVAFSGAFHGVSAGALAATGSAYFRRGLAPGLPPVTSVPYPESPQGPFDTIGLLRRMLEDPSSGVDKPAAVLLETTQGEGGVYPAPDSFLREVRALCDQYGMLMIVDDIQMGCGRTGTFFSFERAGVVPDLVTLSKSIGGYGLPMSLLLIRPEYDVWAPGQHSGTFRGNQLAFVAATAALRTYWADTRLAETVEEHGALVAEALGKLSAGYGVEVRGHGLIWGVDFRTTRLSAKRVSEICFREGLIAETCGRSDEVLKIIPPLTTGRDDLLHGLGVIAEAMAEAQAADWTAGTPRGEG